ncbi:hypothetical protein RF11_08665 [Thelohanellus kitauei]|uniref:Uncharacterized protein n=1 Tax=Thelohanellus kitauei TaxID=669202 RepID=A0A0C2JS42_THEKT|nr:hypothetical protein RF11_02161 [Thelohanellus kitauei]KII72243.1 hypothetical protein RF11_08665 [Thelohanellus kitauei]
MNIIHVFHKIVFDLIDAKIFKGQFPMRFLCKPFEIELLTPPVKNIYMAIEFDRLFVVDGRNVQLLWKLHTIGSKNWIQPSGMLIKFEKVTNLLDDQIMPIRNSIQIIMKTFQMSL